MRQNVTIGLVGNPNCGKSSLFNQLTGSNQRIGNWPGVTVEKKVGCYTQAGINVNVVDLPGIYSLVIASPTSAIDEKITCDYLLSQQANVIVNILDASNLERNLYLTTQLLEMGIPVIVALNMMDVAKQRGHNIDIKKIAQILGCPVIALECNKGKGIKELKQAVEAVVADPQIPHSNLIYPAALESARQALAQLLIQHKLSTTVEANWMALKLLEDDYAARTKVTKDTLETVAIEKQKVESFLNEEVDILIADNRYKFAHQLVQQVVTKKIGTQKGLTFYLDKIVLNRVLGIPIFLTVMYLMFLFAINIGGAFQDFFNISSETIFVQGISGLLSSWHMPTWVTAIIALGIGKGINTTITFIPVIAAMFFFLAALEDSGYMVRAAFVMDRTMRALGLPGKSFVPLIVGFGCNVPAIMATRTLENRRDRILTVMMSPFMSCGARLAIFAVFTTAFFPAGGQNVVFALYLIGILCAVLTGLLLRKTVLQGEAAPMVMEIPPYHIPVLRTVGRQTWLRLKAFLWKAGRFIIPICILISVLNAINMDGTLNIGEADQHSLLAVIGQHLTVLFAPLGLQQDNWPATVGLLSGILAKEVVVGTLNTLYSQVGHIFNPETSTVDFWASLQAALSSIPENLSHLNHAFSNPILASAPEHSVNQGVLGLMYHRFAGQAGAFAYLLFILLYIPCVSTAAVIMRELGKAWMIFSLFWNTSLAYGVAVIFYQAATLTQHASFSIAWILGVSAYFICIMLGLKYYAAQETDKPYTPIQQSSGV